MTEDGVHIPDAVRRQSARADELAREHGLANAPELEESPPEDDQSVETETEEEAPEPVEAPAEPPPTDYEQKYRTLQGKYDSEVPQLRRELDSMRMVVAQMQAPRQPEPAPVTSTTVVVPPEHVEAYGQELIDAARQWARAEITPEIETLRRELGELRGGQQRVETMTVQQRVMAHLSGDPELTGRWETINSNPEFLTWLSQVDPFAGRSRQELLNEAFERGDAVRCARFFKSFIAEQTAVNQHSPAPSVQTPSQGVAERLSLEELAAPGRASGTTSAGGAPEKRTWTNTQIARFYADRQRGVFAGREAEADRLEAEIFEAAREGRIR